MSNWIAFQPKKRSLMRTYEIGWIYAILYDFFEPKESKCLHIYVTTSFLPRISNSTTIVRMGLMEQQFCSRWMSFIIVADSDDHLSFWESNVTDVPTDANFVSRKSNPVFKNYSIAPNAAQIGLAHLGGKSLQTWTPSIHLQGSITRSHLSWKDVSNHFNQFMWPTLLLFNANLAAAWIC